MKRALKDVPKEKKKDGRTRAGKEEARLKFGFDPKSGNNILTFLPNDVLSYICTLLSNMQKLDTFLFQLSADTLVDLNYRYYMFILSNVSKQFRIIARDFLEILSMPILLRPKTPYSVPSTPKTPNTPYFIPSTPTTPGPSFVEPGDNKTNPKMIELKKIISTYNLQLISAYLGHISILEWSFAFPGTSSQTLEIGDKHVSKLFAVSIQSKTPTILILWTKYGNLLLDDQIVEHYTKAYSCDNPYAFRLFNTARNIVRDGASESRKRKEERIFDTGTIYSAIRTGSTRVLDRIHEYNRFRKLLRQMNTKESMLFVNTTTLKTLDWAFNNKYLSLSSINNEGVLKKLAYQDAEMGSDELFRWWYEHQHVDLEKKAPLPPPNGKTIADMVRTRNANYWTVDGKEDAKDKAPLPPPNNQSIADTVRGRNVQYWVPDDTIPKASSSSIPLSKRDNLITIISMLNSILINHLQYPMEQKFLNTIEMYATWLQLQCENDKDIIITMIFGHDGILQELNVL